MHQECATSLAEAKAKIVGDYVAREYKFSVEGCSNFLALPQEEIDTLGLRRGRMTVKIATATRLIDVETYVAFGELLGQEFTGILVPGATSLLGYHVLQNLRYRVNPLTNEIEKVPDDEWHPPFLVEC